MKLLQTHKLVEYIKQSTNEVCISEFEFDEVVAISQLGGNRPQSEVDAIGHAEGQQISESQEATIGDGGEVVAAKENVFEHGKVGE